MLNFIYVLNVLVLKLSYLPLTLNYNISENYNTKKIVGNDILQTPTVCQQSNIKHQWYI